ncbi:hypothetical protein TanjilG_03018 [Lupinus angustifolius]|uniref:Uncharacterized protein n=1 Tax=Lupinus angustifolius TaxID=3871 RepID=A0A4P1RCN2_LUPAN|nr:PREDICTED: uncharacterized protein LOC109351847 isoform X1 [Lupinus angustifolius]OIW08342.1 hypothetical protein TanjilG_03018 [Lupinus angustifolius]
MDVKALAKSKRAHTQHHSKKPHHNQKLKAPTPSSSSSGSNDAAVTAKKPLEKHQLNDKTTHRSSRGLPSNWDRYGEGEFDDGSEGVSPEISGVVLPKSKGADFRYLVAEAQSQAETSLESLPSFDDLILGEFNLGLSSMLAVRGEGSVSWAGDDNFVVEDKGTGNPEASFMSLNLHALAENLAKLDLSKRLFIEPDLLPAELRADYMVKGCNEEPGKLETSEDSELFANMMSKELTLNDFAANHITSSSSPRNSHTASTTTSSNDFLVPVNYVDVEIQQVGSSGKIKAFLPSAEANLHSTKDTRRKNSAFEAATAEEELDMLLDSPSEDKILDFPGYKSNTPFPVSLGASCVNPPQISNKEPVPSKITASLDDALDNLLQETSTLMNPNVVLRPQEESHIQSSSHTGSDSKVSDDFDSWFDTL